MNTKMNKHYIQLASSSESDKFDNQEKSISQDIDLKKAFAQIIDKIKTIYNNLGNSKEEKMIDESIKKCFKNIYKTLDDINKINKDDFVIRSQNKYHIDLEKTMQQNKASIASQSKNNVMGMEIN